MNIDKGIELEWTEQLNAFSRHPQASGETGKDSGSPDVELSGERSMKHVSNHCSHQPIVTMVFWMCLHTTRMFISFAWFHSLPNTANIVEGQIAMLDEMAATGSLFQG